MARELVSPEQASYVLQKLVEQKKINRNDITSALAAMRREISDLEARLAALRQLGARPTRVKARSVRTRSARKKRTPTPGQAASFRLQGQYLGLLRRVPRRTRARYQRMAKEQGREAAIKAMREESEK